MAFVGRLFAIAAILAMVLGFVRWPQPATGFWTITVKNRAYGLGWDYLAFSLGAFFALFAALYYWFPIVFSHTLSERMSQAHFSLSALAAASVLLLAPGLQALTTTRAAATRSDAAFASVVIILISCVLFLVAQGIFVTIVFWAFWKSSAKS